MQRYTVEQLVSVVELQSQLFSAPYFVVHKKAEYDLSIRGKSVNEPCC